MNCAGVHRGLGVHISLVRSQSMDSWNEKQLKFMSLGGNTKLAQFFKNFDLDDEPLQMKYKTKAAHYYRHAVSTSQLSDPPLVETTVRR